MAVRLTLLLWALLIARMFIDTVIDPLPGELEMPVAQLLLLSLGACFLPALVFLETPSDATLDLARRAIEVLGVIALLLILYLGLRGVFEGRILRRLATSVLNPISVGHLGVSVFIVALCGLAGSAVQAKFARWLVIVVSVLVIVASVSRGPILAALLVALVYSFARRRKARIALAYCAAPRRCWRGPVAARRRWLVSYLEEERQHQPDRALDRHAGGRGGAGAHRHDRTARGRSSPSIRSRQCIRRAALLHLSAQHHRRVADGDRHRRAGLLLASLRPRFSRAGASSRSPSLAWIGLIYLQYLVNGMLSGSLFIDTTFWA